MIWVTILGVEDAGVSSQLDDFSVTRTNASDARELMVIQDI